MRRGDLAPDFTLPDQRGALRTLSSLAESGPVVLFFYPAAMTSGCTRECGHFRDLASEFLTLGASRVGISMDAVQRQGEFASKHALDYPLLSDVGGAVARAYGVKRALDLLKVRRTTFVIDRQRRIVEVIGDELHMDAHADRALRALATLG